MSTATTSLEVLKTEVEELFAKYEPKVAAAVKAEADKIEAEVPAVVTALKGELTELISKHETGLLSMFEKAKAWVETEVKAIEGKL